MFNIQNVIFVTFLNGLQIYNIYKNYTLFSGTKSEKTGVILKKKPLNKMNSKN